MMKETRMEKFFLNAVYFAVGVGVLFCFVIAPALALAGAIVE